MTRKNILDEVIDNPWAVAERSAEQRPVIAVLPGYFPSELAAAAGAFPIRMWGGRTATVRADAELQSYICTMAKSVLEDILDGSMDFVSGFVVPAVCDTMQNLTDLIGASGRRVFVFRAPRTSFRGEAGEWLAAEVGRFCEWIAGITGTAPEAGPLALEADRYASARGTLLRMYLERRASPESYPPRFFYGAVLASQVLDPGQFAEWAHELSLWTAPCKPAAGRRVLVSGTAPLPLEFLEVFPSNGLLIADDDLMAGRRVVSKPVMNSFDHADIFEAFLGGAPCPSIVPGHEKRPDYMIGLAREAGAEGVVFWQTKACENEAFDMPWLEGRLREAGLKTVIVETEQKMRSFETAASRLAAFAETL
jgi:benzoyl-CoA reductase/2-hydroxyglutaryl-CoA dehydratase subunit BcrC/BadD/HgdB